MSSIDPCNISFSTTSTNSKWMSSTSTGMWLLTSIFYLSGHLESMVKLSKMQGRFPTSYQSFSHNRLLWKDIGSSKTIPWLFSLSAVRLIGCLVDRRIMPAARKGLERRSSEPFQGLFKSFWKPLELKRLQKWTGKAHKRTKGSGKEMKKYCKGN